MASKSVSEEIVVPIPTEIAAASPGLPRQVLDALDQVVVALDRDRRVLYANRRIEELLGVDPESLIGMAAKDLFAGIDAKWLRGASSEPREFKLTAEGREVTLKAEAAQVRSET